MIDRTMTTEDLPDWFNELLFLRCTEGLTSEQQRQFDEFVSEHPNRSHIESEVEKFELTVAAIDLSFEDNATNRESLPPDLRQKLVDGANRFWDTEREKRGLEKVTLAPPQQPISKSGFSTREAMAWLAAAVAVILLLSGLNPFAFPSDKDDLPDSGQVAKVLSVEEHYEEFLASEDVGSNLKQVAWEVQPGYKGEGEVAWRDDLQKGYMTFANLPANDPETSQYQLWIFDEKRDPSQPVDGGVFDVRPNGTTVVEIDSKLLVSNAVMFAITEEVPGGVVVSKREKLPLLAKVGP